MDINKLYEENKKEIEDIDKIIKTEGVSLFGAGQYGEFVSEYLLKNGYKINCFIDNNPDKQGNKINDIEIVSKDSVLSKNSKVVLITAHHSIDEIIEQNKNSYKHIISFEKYLAIKRFDDFLNIRNMLYDNNSKEILDTLVYAKISGDENLCENIYEDNQYFAIPKFKFGSINEIFFNVGAYTGDTVERIIYSRLGGFKHIYAFEPGKKQFEAMNIRIERLKKEWAINDNKITLVNLGVSDKNEILEFNDNSDLLCNRVSNIKENTIKIETCSVDNFLNGKEINFLISDIEGYEINMLKGAINTIKNYKPKMAISVYHKPDDLLAIPEFIRNLVPEYKFALRHHNITFDDTVLYCWIEKETRQDKTRILVMFEYGFKKAV